LTEIFEFLFTEQDIKDEDRSTVKEFARTFLYGKDRVSNILFIERQFPCSYCNHVQ